MQLWVSQNEPLLVLVLVLDVELLHEVGSYALLEGSHGSPESVDPPDPESVDV